MDRGAGGAHPRGAPVRGRAARDVPRSARPLLAGNGPGPSPDARRGAPADRRHRRHAARHDRGLRRARPRGARVPHAGAGGYGALRGHRDRSRRARGALGAAHGPDALLRPREPAPDHDLSRVPAPPRRAAAARGPRLLLRRRGAAAGGGGAARARARGPRAGARVRAAARPFPRPREVVPPRARPAARPHPGADGAHGGLSPHPHGDERRRRNAPHALPMDDGALARRRRRRGRVPPRPRGRGIRPPGARARLCDRRLLRGAPRARPARGGGRGDPRAPARAGGA
jgi:hypothetical protein